MPDFLFYECEYMWMTAQENESSVQTQSLSLTFITVNCLKLEIFNYLQR